MSFLYLICAEGHACLFQQNEFCLGLGDSGRTLKPAAAMTRLI